MPSLKRRFKHLVGYLPWLPEMDWYFRFDNTAPKFFNLEKLERSLVDWVQIAQASPYKNNSGKRIFIFSALHYWIEHAAAIGIALAGLGHDITFTYAPYARWHRTINRYDLRRTYSYGKRVIEKANPVMKTISLLDLPEAKVLPNEIKEAIHNLTVRDVQYTEQLEEVNTDGRLFKLRMYRNRLAAKTTLNWLETNRPDVVVIPNGLIMEFGAVYQVAKYLGIPVVSYEFGEQRDKIWLSDGREVMIQDTNSMWAGCKDRPFGDQEMEKIKDLFNTRAGAGLWNNFYRQWQSQPSEGAQAVKEKLNLDDRPIVLCAANVIGDSLTLGRQVFSDSMTDWLRRTMRHLAKRDDFQFVLRAHPGEKNLSGPSVVDVAQEILPDMPSNFHLIGPAEPINTYDLMQLADVGLVYTTTVGMEMAMSGTPTVVIGRTHYRDKGFTIDPGSWEEFFGILDQALDEPGSLKPSPEQVQQAWHYAYRFFFDYPHDFPWHLIHFEDSLKEWPMDKALTAEGLESFGKTFDYLAGSPIEWA